MTNLLDDLPANRMAESTNRAHGPTPEVHTSLLEIQAWARKLENRIAELEDKVTSLASRLNVLESAHTNDGTHYLYLLEVDNPFTQWVCVVQRGNERYNPGSAGLLGCKSH